MQVEADAQCLQHTPPNLVFERVIAKESQMGWPAARGDARPNRHAQTAEAPGSQAIQVGGPGRFQLRGPARFHRQPSQAINDQHDDLAVVSDLQFPHQLKVSHDLSFLSTWRQFFGIIAHLARFCTP